MNKPKKHSQEERLEDLERFADEMTKWGHLVREATIFAPAPAPPVPYPPVLPLHFDCTCGYHPCVCDTEHRERR